MKMRARFAVLGVLVLLARIILGVENEKARAEFPVVRVIDGDTLVVLMDARDVTVRLIGVAAPERAEPYGGEATTFLTNLLLGESISLEYEGGVPHLDRFGRTLGYVYRQPDGLAVNSEVVRQGYGSVYDEKHFSQEPVFRRYESRARSVKKGLWALPRAASVPVPSPRRSAPKLSIGVAEIQRLVTSCLGKTNREIPRFQAAEVSPWDPPSQVKVSVTFAADDNLTKGFIKSGACMDITKLAEKLEQCITNLGYLEVVATFSLQDRWGNAKEQPVIHAGFSRETLKKVKWANLYGEGILKAADFARVIPALE